MSAGPAVAAAAPAAGSGRLARRIGGRVAALLAVALAWEGLVLLLGYLAVSWGLLRRRIPDDPATNAFRSSLAAGFVIALVGSMFLTEQYYAPLWLLPALGATLVSARGRSQPLETVA